ncbi:MAG: hypothetical protein CM1200mP30_07460 [Pseudomonadota bacterium]|nr:MAG: hypothetical protein CM1200mP30_07460 [Pseudomonadota bacterium]
MAPGSDILGIGWEELVTAWVALSPSNPQSGCMKMLPGSHLEGEKPITHLRKNNILHRGQELGKGSRHERQ